MAKQKRPGYTSRSSSDFPVTRLRRWHARQARDGRTERYVEIGHIALEIAILGRSGLQINDPDKLYSLKTLAGEYTGLHLLALMHAGMKLVDETVDSEAGFDKEFDIAKAMAGKR